MIARLICACLLVLALFACGEELSVEQQIIRTINEMEALAEAGERRDFMEFVAGEFDGQLGRLTKEEFRRFMVLQWNENQRLNAQLGPISVTELGEGMAAADFSGLITGGRGLLPERGQMFNFETSWLMIDGQWQLVSAVWEPIRLD
jgi:hypothetical protein